MTLTSNQHARVAGSRSLHAVGRFQAHTHGAARLRAGPPREALAGTNHECRGPQARWLVCALVLLVFIGVSACVPLTFSREEAIDFSVYRRAWVDVQLTGAAGFYGSPSASAYLARELRAGSGFETVTTDPLDAVDVLLNVEVNLVEVVTYHEDGVDFSYDSSAEFAAFDRMGSRIDHGRESDSSDFPSEAIEDALDEVALHFLRPYRL